jgi:hypothetical protein
MNACDLLPAFNLAAQIWREQVAADTYPQEVLDAANTLELAIINMMARISAMSADKRLAKEKIIDNADRVLDGSDDGEPVTVNLRCSIARDRARRSHPRAEHCAVVNNMATRDYDKSVPIRINLAAKIAFPDGSIGPKGLRKERDAGRLVTEIIADREYVTLAAIEEMRELCRVRPKEPALSGEKRAGSPTAPFPTPPDGMSAKETASIAQEKAKQILARLKKSSRAFSSPGTPRPGRRGGSNITS